MYPMELIAIVAARQLAARIQTPTSKEIITDSQQEVAALTAHKQLHCTYETTTTFESFEGAIRWTPAHPEKRCSISTNRSRDDSLNHVVDKVTIGNVDFDIDCQYELTEVQVIRNPILLYKSFT